MSICVRQFSHVMKFRSKKICLSELYHPFGTSYNLWEDAVERRNCSTYTDGIQPTTHIPVMTEEVLKIMSPTTGKTLIDMTFGGGGHSRKLLQETCGLQLVTVDRDPSAFTAAKVLASEVNSQSTVIPMLGRFSEVHHHLAAHGIEQGTVDGILFDLGASSLQFDQPERGFSISRDGPLDMRMDGNRFPDQPTAAEIVNHLDASDLALILKNYGEERLCHSIAQAIVEARYAFGNITRTAQLAQIIDTVFEGNHRQDKLQRYAHPATKVFQALRIFVNNELNEVHNGLELAWQYLRPGGCCVVIAFHSLEDRIVKRHFHGIELDDQTNMTVADHHRNAAMFQPMQTAQQFLQKRWRPVSKKVQTPSVEEIIENPRSRSAKLRAAVKLKNSEDL